MKERKVRIIRKIVLILAIIIFTCSCIYLFKQTKYSEYKEQKRIQTIKQQIVEEEQVEIEENEETGEKKTINLESINEEGGILSKFRKVYEKNSDFYGWITIEGTKVDNPVMYCQQDTLSYYAGNYNAGYEDYYLHRNFEGEISAAGELFVDIRTVFEETENIIIYGHNMRNGTMFGTLKKYKDQKFYEDHKYIEFETLYEEAEYEIVAVSKTIASNEGYQYYDHVELDSKEEFDAYIQNAKNNSYFDTGVTAEYGDTLITLSTCDYWADNARLYIVAKKIQREP